jgi:hypothetical protein
MKGITSVTFDLVPIDSVGMHDAREDRMFCAYYANVLLQHRDYAVVTRLDQLHALRMALSYFSYARQFMLDLEGKLNVNFEQCPLFEIDMLSVVDVLQFPPELLSPREFAIVPEMLHVDVGNRFKRPLKNQKYSRFGDGANVELLVFTRMGNKKLCIGHGLIAPRESMASHDGAGTFTDSPLSSKCSAVFSMNVRGVSWNVVALVNVTIDDMYSNMPHPLSSTSLTLSEALQDANGCFVWPVECLSLADESAEKASDSSDSDAVSADESDVHTGDEARRSFTTLTSTRRLEISPAASESAINGNEDGASAADRAPKRVVKPRKQS